MIFCEFEFWFFDKIKMENLEADNCLFESKVEFSLKVNKMKDNRGSKTVKGDSNKKRNILTANSGSKAACDEQKKSTFCNIKQDDVQHKAGVYSKYRDNSILSANQIRPADKYTNAVKASSFQETCDYSDDASTSTATTIINTKIPERSYELINLPKPPLDWLQNISNAPLENRFEYQESLNNSSKIKEEPLKTRKEKESILPNLLNLLNFD